jgi:type IV pilus biogenesis protein CpaD/CtpE
MSGKVSIMYKATFEFRPAVLLLGVALSAILSGCVSDDEMTGKHVPFRLEERYPLTTKEAVALRQADPATLCRNWHEDLADTTANTVAPNHGCAVRVNMAAQLADPADLDNPNPMTPAPAAPRSNAVNSVGAVQPTTSRSIFSLF